MSSEARSPAPALDHKCAMAIVIPRRYWDNIQRFRCFNDKGFVRWPPHMNLLYPFHADVRENFDRAATKALDAIASLPPFQITLSSTGFFNHGRSCTLWLKPESEGLMQLQSTLFKAFPECKDLNEDPTRDIQEFVPHLSLGQWPNADAVQQAGQEFEAQWQRITFMASHVMLMSRQGYTEPFRIRYTVPLSGQAQGVSQVNVPYISSVGPDQDSPHDRLEPDLGVGTLDRTGTWYFAYGANMSPHKLSNVRGITPIESAAGSIAGWTLAFNHRGAMGNLVKLKTGEAGNAGLTAAHGVLHLLKPVDMAKLCYMEHEYMPTELVAELYDGRTVRAIAYCSPPETCIQSGLPPPDRYVKLLCEGAREFGLEPSITKWLHSIEVVPTRERGNPYWQSPEGRHIRARTRIWVGDPKQNSGRGGRGNSNGGRNSPHAPLRSNVDN
ncbi:hypothetical protein WJX73_002766 [Symbiochloris irregularis]|uniref:Gamma-glutamylcyclotransferase n=1 Tax=Symbiochloris irregularis TaxID=706552 RepID=A0AAW1P3B3_9CHLO